MRQIARHDVVFAAGTAGEHELTWSQKAHEREGCHPHLHGPRNRNVRMGRALDGRPDMAAVLHAFAAVMAHFEALRTLYPREADGHLRAVVVASGVLQVDEYASDARATSDELSAFTLRLAEPGFAPDDLPLRAAVITVDGRPIHIVLSLHHFSADTTAARIVAEHIARLAADPGADLGSGWQPRQIASFEGSPSGLRHAHRVDTHDRAMLRQSVMPELQTPASHRDTVYNFVCLDSAAVALAAARLAKQYRTSVAAVLQAAYACALAELLSIGTCVFNTVMANRQTAFAREAVAHVAGRALVPVDTSLGSDRFPALCRAVDAALARSSSVSLREPDRYARSLDEVSAELGRSAHNPYMVNVRPIAPGTLIRARALRAQQDLERAMASSRYRRFPKPVDTYSGKLCFDVWGMSETAGISLGTDATSFDATDLEQVLLSFERRLVGAAIGGHAAQSGSFAGA
ncbi:condensation domain-containing protein [Streptomyces sp. TLI_185]|uniref:condensation domain-containing protein n=1 Tax=Streptomyces sp. TLI_185 TaxID=2485151 RepID=UPI000F4FCD94|nr:condensation domain-containing protein [Streptomyces sp. TLI_185]RPF30537.1 condensation domain-containing protein [Streptomyces sp. TLI_185]